MKNVSTFGEIMLRISPKNEGELFTHGKSFLIEPGGSESNVSIALSNLGVPSKFITTLPDNQLSEIVIQYLKRFNVDTSGIKYGGNRLGVYWTENGNGIRGSKVIYDRQNSSFSETSIDEISWESIFQESCWFHFSGISPSLSKNIYDLLDKAISLIDIKYSVDLNYRSKLWNWVDKDSEKIRNILERLCRKANLIAGNESDFNDIFGMKPGSKVADDYFHSIAQTCFDRFPLLEYVAISNRESISASHNRWNGYLFTKGGRNTFKGKTYEIIPIVDRVGTGDSFVAGIIYGLIHKDRFSNQATVDFASTLAALNHSTTGDASRFSPDEVWKVFNTSGTGRISR
jgi:2-dehydro-3-deoxygluconokinase